MTARIGITWRTAAALSALVVLLPLLVFVDPSPSSAHTQTVRRCAYDPFAGQQCWNESVSHTHTSNNYAPPPDTSPPTTAAPTTTVPTTTAPPPPATLPVPNHYSPPPDTTTKTTTPPTTPQPNHYSPPPDTSPKPKTCPAGTTGTPPNCLPVPSDNTNHTCPAGTTGTPPNCLPVPSDNTRQSGNQGDGSDGDSDSDGDTEPDGDTESDSDTEPDGDDCEGDDCGDESEPEDESTSEDDDTEPDGDRGETAQTADPCEAWADRTRDALHNSNPEGVTPQPEGCGISSSEIAGWAWDRLRSAQQTQDAAVRAAVRKAALAALNAVELKSEYDDWATEQLLRAWDSLEPWEKDLAIGAACTTLGFAAGAAVAASAAAAPAAPYVTVGVTLGCGVVLSELERNRDNSAPATTPAPSSTPPNDQQEQSSSSAPQEDASTETVKPVQTPDTSTQTEPVAPSNPNGDQGSDTGQSDSAAPQPPTTESPSDTVTEQDWRQARAEWKRGLRPRSDFYELFNRWLCQTRGWQTACDLADEYANGR